MPRVTRKSGLSKAESKENIVTVEVTPERKQPTRKSKRKSPSNSSNEDSSSPPKSTRSNSMSPLGSQFAEKLNLSTPKSVKKRSVKRALVDNVNFRLPGREKEFDELSKYINNIIDTDGSGSMYISGAPGTGKTATLNKIINSKEFKKKLKIAYINCTGISSIGAIYKKTCQELNITIKRESSKDCLEAIEKHLASKHKMTLLILDEIDQLCTTDKKQSILYNIFEWPAKPNAKIILIGIANSLDLTDRMLSRLKVKCELQPNVMQFTAYTKSQIVDIFKSRLEESGVTDLFPPAAIQLLAAKVSSVSGDIRRALSIGKRVAELADAERKKNVKAIDIKQLEALIETEESSDEAKQQVVSTVQQESKIQLKEVVTVLQSVFGNAQNLGDDVDDSFPIQQKILICTLLLIIKNEKNKSIPLGRLHDVYKKVCKNRNILSIGLDEFLNLCSLSESRGIIKIITKKESRFHQVQLRWDEEEVYAALKDKQMVTNIINERSLLNR